jgi:hypothetical protein
VSSGLGAWLVWTWGLDPLLQPPTPPQMPTPLLPVTGAQLETVHSRGITAKWLMTSD